MKLETLALLALGVSACAIPAERHAPEGPTSGAQPQSGRATATSAAASFRFFVTSTGVDGSAALGGLAGADAHCQSLARAVGAGDRTWRAYLSTSGASGEQAVDARDRIGNGPWYNAKGRLIARNLEELHSDRNGITRHTALTELGDVPEKSHDILTGSDEDGRLAYAGGVPATCADWTASEEGIARIGHNDRMDSEAFDNPRFKRWCGSWVSEHDTAGCSRAHLGRTGGAGLFYCFASDDFAPHREEAAIASTATFVRGLNVNHWIGDNLPEKLLPGSGYAAPWFDEEDVQWIASQGFDHVRVWVAGHRWIDGRGDLDEAALEPFDRLLGWAKARGLGVVLAMHSTPGYRAGLRGEAPAAGASSPFVDEATQGDAAYLWWLVARRYAREADALRFELIVQPDAPSAAAMQAFNREALAAIRRTSPLRMVHLTAHDEAIESVGEVDLTDPRTSLSVRFWEPVSFTYQIDPKRPKVSFSAGTERAVVDAAAVLAKQMKVAGPHRVYVAEFGVAKGADDPSARRYVRATRAALEREGFSWAIYDYHTAFAVRDRQGKPTRVIEALTTDEPPRHP